MDRFYSGAATIFAATTMVATWFLVAFDPASPLRWLIAVAAFGTSALLLARAQVMEREEEERAASPLERDQIEEALAREIFRARRYERPFAALLIQIVSPGAVDQLERETKKLIRKTDEVGRWSEDRLLLVLAESSEEDAMQLADRLRNAIEADLRFGVTGYRPEDSTHTLMKRLEASLEQTGAVSQRVDAIGDEARRGEVRFE